MNHTNRNSQARATNLAVRLLEALKEEGLQVSTEQENTVIRLACAKKKVNYLDGDAVSAVADELGFDVRVYVRGKYSMGVDFLNDHGEYRTIDVKCTGETYYITVEDGANFDKWFMPRDEVSGDRADKFLIEVLRTLDEANGRLIEAVDLCLGISGRASLSHTKYTLAERRANKNA